jgi:hypothetical protein
LPGDEGKARAQLQQEGFQLPADQSLGLFRERGALVEHRVDARTKGTHAPAFDPGHLRVEFPLEGLTERQKGAEVGDGLWGAQEPSKHQRSAFPIWGNVGHVGHVQLSLFGNFSPIRYNVQSYRRRRKCVARVSTSLGF